MPLRITIELIPRGDESRKRKLAVVNIENDGTAGDGRGNGEVGNYRVSAAGDCGEAGWDDFAAFTIGPLKRGNHVDTCAEVMASLHSQRTPEHGSEAQGVLSKLQEYEDALNELYHATSCTTGQMEIINSVLPQRVDDGSNEMHEAAEGERAERGRSVWARKYRRVTDIKGLSALPGNDTAADQ